MDIVQVLGDEIRRVGRDGCCRRGGLAIHIKGMENIT